MVSISKFGDSAIKFTFDDSDHYLMGDGEITVPVNGLILVLDESDMATFKKIDGDPFISFNIANSNFSSKSDLETFYKENMVGSTGGGGGVTEEWVEEYVSESVSGLSDDISTVSGATESLHSAVTELSGQVETDEKVTANALVDLDNRKLDASAYTPTDLSNYYTKSQTNTQINNATDSLLDAGEFYEYTSSNDERVGDIEDRLSEDEEVTSAALNELNDALDDKADTSAVTASIAAAVSGKQDTLIAGTNIKTINNESLLGSGNIDIQGGGKAIEAGRGISITTGATADTVSFNLPISASTKSESVYGGGAKNNGGTYSFGYSLRAAANGMFSFAFGKDTIAGADNSTAINGGRTYRNYSVAIGYMASANGDYSSAIGEEVQTTNEAEHSQGKHNVSNKANNTWGDSGNTLFSVGNGTAANARHNAFGDIYITKDGSDVKLQDQLGGGGLPESAFTAYTASTDARLAEDEEVTAASLNALNDAIDDKADASDLGGLKLVQLTQAQYDALTTKDSSTLYIITSSN